MENQIILLPRDNYGAWINATQRYLREFGVNCTSDPAAAGAYVHPHQVVTVVTTRDPLWAYGYDIVDWLQRNYRGVVLDVIVADTPDELAHELDGRVRASNRYLPADQAGSPGPAAATPEPEPVVPTVLSAPEPEPEPVSVAPTLLSAPELESQPAPMAPPSSPATQPRPAAALPAPMAGQKLAGRLDLHGERTTFWRGEAVFFRETITNPANAAVDYGVLGVQVTRLADGWTFFHTSWSGALLIEAGATGPGANGPWDDCVRLDLPGEYRLALAVCYSTKEEALSGGEWELLSAPVTVTIE